jgi:N-acetyl-beta-hexosaminidase
MTEIVGQVQASTVQAQVNSIVNSVNTVVSPGKFVFWVGIDGTKNIASNPSHSDDKISTAIGSMKDQVNDTVIVNGVVIDNPNLKMGYYPGVGTPGTQWGSAAFPMEQSEITARQIINEFAQVANDWLLGHL